MNQYLDYTNYTHFAASISISGSKSESNRLLLLQKIFPNLLLLNLSDSDDTVHFQKALQTNSSQIDIGHAGTAMRFLTAYFASKEGREITLTGSQRMKERPIEVLVNALRKLGASIKYLNKEGYPPLQISGKKLGGNILEIPSNVSSQYISALLLISPLFETDFQLKLVGEVSSLPYIEMTLALLHQMGIKNTFENNIICIPKQKIDIKHTQTINIESDWSSASYYFSLVALSNVGSSIVLNNFYEKSLQGDRILVEIYKIFGVKTTFDGHRMTIKKEKKVSFDEPLQFDLINSPDIAQTLAVTCLGLNIEVEIKGLHTLKIKETDRLNALKTELEKLGASVSITDKSLKLISPKKLNQFINIDTYDDHRMAMSFAPLSVVVPLTIKHAAVVSKSYKNFWADFQSLFNS